MSEQHMKDPCASACGAIGKGAALRRPAALELMAHRGPIGDPRVAADRIRLRPIAAVKWDSALHLCKSVADIRLDFQGLDSGLATQMLRQLKLDGQSQKDNVKTALNAALGGVWHEAVEDLEHIVHHCPAWAAEKRQVEAPVELPASAFEGQWRLLLVSGFMDWSRWVWSASSHPHFWRCGVGYYTDTGESVWLPGLEQTVYRAEFLDTVRALEE
eukprot:3313329-Amphidinium_carterae.1